MLQEQIPAETQSTQMMKYRKGVHLCVLYASLEKHHLVEAPSLDALW